MQSMSGTFAQRPLATAVAKGTLYFATDDGNGRLYRSDGTGWTAAAGRSSGSINSATGESNAYTSTSYGDPSNGPISVDVNTPSGIPVIVSVGLLGLWRGTHASGASTFGNLALFVGANQIKVPAFGAAPAVTEAGLVSSLDGTNPASTTSTGDATFSAYHSGVVASLAHTSSSNDQSVVSTGQVLSLTYSNGLAYGGLCPIYLPGGATYTIALKVKAAAGCSVFIKDPKIWVRLEPFGQ